MNVKLRFITGHYNKTLVGRVRYLIFISKDIGYFLVQRFPRFTTGIPFLEIGKILADNKNDNVIVIASTIFK